MIHRGDIRTLIIDRYTSYFIFQDGEKTFKAITERFEELSVSQTYVDSFEFANHCHEFLLAS